MARYQYAALKEQTYPDLPEIRKAMQAADQDDEKRRDVRKLKAIEMRMVASAPRLRGHILTRRTAVTAYDWDFVPYDKVDADRAAEAKTRLTGIVNAVLNRHTQTPMFGELAIRLEAEQRIDGKWHLKIARIYRPDELERTGDDLEQVAVLKSEGRTVTREYLTDPQEWLWEVDSDTFEQGGVLRSLIPHERLRHDSIMEWANFNLKVKGLVLAKLKEHASDDDKITAKQSLVNIRKEGYSITSDNVEYDYQQTVNQIGATSFKDIKQTLEDDEAIAILGQANTTQLPANGGSRAALQVLNLIRIDIHYSDIVRIEQWLMPMLLLIDYQLNYDQTAIAAPWAFRFLLAETRDSEKEARTVSEMLEAQLPLLRSEVYERVGYSVPRPGDDVIAPATPTPPLPIPAG